MTDEIKKKWQESPHREEDTPELQQLLIKQKQLAEQEELRKAKELEEKKALELKQA